MEITRLVKRAKRKDADAFTELMESQMQNMYKAARSVLCNDEDSCMLGKDRYAKEKSVFSDMDDPDSY